MITVLVSFGIIVAAAVFFDWLLRPSGTGEAEAADDHGHH